MTHITFTGPCKQLTRSQLAALASQRGFKVHSSLCGPVTLLVGNAETIVDETSTKARKAVARHIPSMSYQEFVRRFGA